MRFFGDYWQNFGELIGRSATAGGGVAYDEYVQALVNAGAAVAWYRFNEVSGTTLVNHGSAGNALNGTLTADNAALVRPKDGQIGTGEAWDFTVANNALVTIPQHASLTGLTNQTWIFLANPRSQGEGELSQFLRWALTGWRINYTITDTINFAIPYSTTSASASIADPLTGWRGFVFEHNATTRVSTIRLMESGSVVTPAQTPTPGVGTLTAPSSTLTLFNNSLNSAGFDGLCDELIVLNRVGTSEEYTQLAQFFT